MYYVLPAMTFWHSLKHQRVMPAVQHGSVWCPTRTCHVCTYRSPPRPHCACRRPFFAAQVQHGRLLERMEFLDCGAAPCVCEHASALFLVVIVHRLAWCAQVAQRQLVAVAFALFASVVLLRGVNCVVLVCVVLALSLCACVALHGVFSFLFFLRRAVLVTGHYRPTTRRSAPRCRRRPGRSGPRRTGTPPW